MKRSDEQGRLDSYGHVEPSLLNVFAAVLDSYKEKRGGWGSTLLPFYIIGVLLYVIYIVGKIIQKKVRKSNMLSPVNSSLSYFN